MIDLKPIAGKFFNNFRLFFSVKQPFTHLLLNATLAIYAFTPVSASGPGDTFLKTYGGQSFDAATALVKASDGGYVLAGRSASASSGNTDIVVMKIDEAGSLVWESRFGEEGTEEANDIVPTPDGGYIIAGFSDSFGAGEDIKDVWLVKVDARGEKVWTQKFGNDHSIDEAKGISAAHDGGYIVIGTTFHIGADDAYSNILLIKISEEGEKIWEKEIGGDSNEQGSDIVKTDDGYTLIGNTESYGRGKWDIWLVHIDKEGNSIWEKTFGGGDNEMGNALIATDNGYIIAGYTYSFAVASLDAWVVKVDLEGNQIWAKAFGGLSTDEALGIIQTADGNYAMVGYTEVWKDDGQGMNASNDGHNVYVVKIDKEGEKIWEKSIGGPQEQRGFGICSTPEQGLMIAGLTASNPENGVDMLVLKIGQNGQEPALAE